MTVGWIRRVVYDRQFGRCLDCDTFVRWENAHLHEIVPRSKGGKISLENSVILCADCHLNAPQNHGDRKPQFSS